MYAIQTKETRTAAVVLLVGKNITEIYETNNNKADPPSPPKKK